MKRDRILAVLLVLALALSLAGCGGFGMRMALAARRMEKLRSYSMDISLDTELSFTVLGQELPIELKIASSGDVNTDPMKSRMLTTFELFGQEASVLSYTVKEDAGYTACVSPDGGRSWTRQRVEKELPGASGAGSLTGLLRLASAFEPTGTETVRGSEAEVYAGTITGKDLQTLLEASGAMEDMLAAMNLPAESLDLESCGDIPLTVAIDRKSGMVTRFTADLTTFMAAFAPRLLDAALSAWAGELGLGALGLGDPDVGSSGLKMETGRVFMSVELYSFDTAGAVEIPPEALA